MRLATPVDGIETQAAVSSVRGSGSGRGYHVFNRCILCILSTQIQWGDRSHTALRATSHVLLTAEVQDGSAIPRTSHNTRRRPSNCPRVRFHLPGRRVVSPNGACTLGSRLDAVWDPSVSDKAGGC